MLTEVRKYEDVLQELLTIRELIAEHIPSLLDHRRRRILSKVFWCGLVALAVGLLTYVLT